MKANKGAPGVDAVSVEEFERDLKNNLYKIWNRLSSGTYFPPPVRAVHIPKPNGGARVLGVPTVGDRIAQTVVASVLESAAEPVFHIDSYGYRRGRSAIDAVGQCRERCWKSDWVIDLDIRAFFDSVPWVEAHTDQSRSWGCCTCGGGSKPRCCCPAGRCVSETAVLRRGRLVSPILANLFLHYAFDAWMARTFPTVAFERYLDDAVVHCVSERQARLYVPRSRSGWAGSGLSCIRTRLGSCTARTLTGVAPTSTSSSHSWDTHSAGGPRSAGMDGCSCPSCPRSVMRLYVGSVPGCGPGGSTIALT